MEISLCTYENAVQFHARTILSLNQASMDEINSWNSGDEHDEKPTKNKKRKEKN